MMVVGLTGGIGSGKTTVAQMFYKLGVPIYIADDEAKGIIHRSGVIRRKLITLFGERAYNNNELDRAYIASKIFNSPDLLHQMNAIIHPRVRAHFRRWLKKQKTSYVIYEAAILFEHNGHKQCDYVITVTAPKKERIARIIKRDDTTIKRVEAIMNNQWTDERKIKLSDFVIENISISATDGQVKQIHKKLLSLRQ